MRRLTIRDRIDNAAYTLVHAIKTRIDNDRRGCYPFAVLGFAHVHKLSAAMNDATQAGTRFADLVQKYVARFTGNA